MKLFVSNNIPGVGEVVAPDISDYSSVRMQNQSGYDNMDMNTYSIPYNQSNKI